MQFKELIEFENSQISGFYRYNLFDKASIVIKIEKTILEKYCYKPYNLLILKNSRKTTEGFHSCNSSQLLF